MADDLKRYQAALEAGADLLTEKDVQIELLRQRYERFRAAADPIVYGLSKNVSKDDGEWATWITYGQVRALARAMEPEGE